MDANTPTVVIALYRYISVISGEQEIEQRKMNNRVDSNVITEPRPSHDCSKEPLCWGQ
jgi:hypothetical protein